MKASSAKRSTTRRSTALAGPWSAAPAPDFVPPLRQPGVSTSESQPVTVDRPAVDRADALLNGSPNPFTLNNYRIRSWRGSACRPSLHNNNASQRPCSQSLTPRNLEYGPQSEANLSERLTVCNSPCRELPKLSTVSVDYKLFNPK